MPDDGPEQGHQCALPHHVTRQVPACALDQFVVVVVVVVVVIIVTAVVHRHVRVSWSDDFASTTPTPTRAVPCLRAG